MKRTFLLIVLFLIGCTTTTPIVKGPDYPKLPSHETISAQPKEDHKTLAKYYYLMAQIALQHDEIERAIGLLNKAWEQDKKSYEIPIELARIHFQKNEPEKAIEILQGLLKRNPKHIPTLQVLGKIYFSLNRLSEAQAIYEKILSQEKNNREALLFYSLVAIKEKKYEKAITHLKRLISSNPEELNGYIYLSKVYMEIDKPNEAAYYLTKLIEINPDYEPGYYDLLGIYMRKKEYDKAIQVIDLLLKNHPRNRRAIETKLRILLQKRDSKGIRETIDTLIKLFPSKETFLRTGLIFLHSKDYKNALVVLERGIRKYPKSDQLRYYLSLAYIRTKSFEKAMNYLNKIEKDSEFFVDARIQMASILEDEEKYNEAKKLIEETLAIKPNEPSLYLVLGMIYEIQKEYKKAADIFRKGIDIAKDKESAELHFRLGVVLDKMKRQKEALRQMEEVIKINPDHAEALNYLGYSLAEKGIELDRAEQLIKKALAIKPKSAYIIDSLGWVYYKKGKIKKALPLIEKASKLMPNDPIVTEHLAEIYFKLGKFKEALSIYKKVIKLDSKKAKQLKDIINKLEHIVKSK